MSGYINTAQAHVFSGDLGGSVGPIGWFRFLDSITLPHWRVDVSVGGQWLTARAVIDDFGDLVLVERLK